MTNEQTNEEIRSFIEPELNRELLRYSIQREIFCPCCSGVLDIARAVYCDISYDRSMAFCVVTCAPCWDSKIGERVASGYDAVRTRIESGEIPGKTADKYSITIIDGRQS
jgi:hypothetical protein